MRYRHIALLLALFIATAAMGGLVVTDDSAPSTIDNDDSCDIGVFPSATLLVPYFSVNTTNRNETTLLTITNVSPQPQIANIALWTDWGFPVFYFNVFLTGYDTQSLDLWDVLVAGVIAPQGPGTSATNPAISPNPTTGVVGAIPLRNTANANIELSSVTTGGSCSRLPGSIPVELARSVTTALTTGLFNVGVPQGPNCGTTRVGSPHTNASGYITINVVSNCTLRPPDDPNYFRADLLYDNVLLGEYQHVNATAATGNYAQGNPMVHIRAIPEGGRAGSTPGTNLPYTFYDRFTPEGLRNMDRRQPLPAQFAARWIEGGAGGFNTNYTIWREGYSRGEQSCAEADDNSEMTIAKIVRFDERENSFGYGGATLCSPCGPPVEPVSPAATVRPTQDYVFPDNAGTDVAGWMFLDLNNGGSASYTATSSAFAPGNSLTTVRASQNWVTVTMFAEGRFSTGNDAAMLSNGCTPARATNAPIAPAANDNP